VFSLSLSEALGLELRASSLLGSCSSHLRCLGSNESLVLCFSKINKPLGMMIIALWTEDTESVASAW
jgi:hypothetical protein